MRAAIRSQEAFGGRRDASSLSDTQLHERQAVAEVTRANLRQWADDQVEAISLLQVESEERAESLELQPGITGRSSGSLAPRVGLKAARRAANEAVDGLNDQLDLLQKDRSRQRKIRIYALMVLLAVLGGGLLAIQGLRENRSATWATATAEAVMAQKTVTAGVEATSVAMEAAAAAVVATAAADAWATRVALAEQGELLNTLEGHTDNVNSVAFSPGGQILASGSLDGTVILWRVSDGKLMHSLMKNAGSVKSVAFSPDGQVLASGSSDGALQLWRVSDGQPMHFMKNGSSVNSVAFSPDSQVLIYGSSDGTVGLWRVNDGVPLNSYSFGGDRDIILSVAVSPEAVSPEDKAMVIARFSGRIGLRRISDFTPLITLEEVPGAVYSVAFSPDGRTIASGSDNGKTRLWRVSDGELLNTLGASRGSNNIYSVAFSPNGRTMASGTSASTIRLWDVADGRLLQTLGGHASAVNSVAFSPDGRMLASGSSDDTIRLWRVGQ